MIFLENINGRIGVWGYGVVGAAVVRFLVREKKQIAVYDTDSNKLSDNYLSKNDILVFSKERIEEFFRSCSVIIPSPGVDVRPYVSHNNVYLSELDLFSQYWKKPIIAVTGSVGKTSITTILGMLLNQNGYTTAVGGNIGIGSIDLIDMQASVDYALLELSSFQLEHTQQFTPHIAIITNLYANHLDRHETLDLYWNAKARICVRQTPHDLLIIDWALRDHVRALNIHNSVWYIGNYEPIAQNMLLPHEEYWYCTSKTEIQVVRKENYQTYRVPESLFSHTFSHNALITFAALVKLTHNNLFALTFNCDNLSLAHRREFVGTWNGITFINDSKATSIAAMQAAVNHYQQYPTYLLLGGLSKGVDRTPALSTIPSSVQEIICFGAEAEQLHTAAQKVRLHSSLHPTLDAAFTYVVNNATPNSIALLSPAGSSFDLYKNYEERGDHFKKLVKKLIEKKI